MIRPIRSDEDYQAALRRIEELMDAAPGTPEFDELEVRTTLVERWEADHYPMDLPSPLATIRFVMDQRGLTARDLVPLIGSRGKVSEVLSGKQGLTLSMIRALHAGLGIPADLLIGQPGAKLPTEGEETDWRRFPLAAMARLGWLSGTSADLRSRAEDIMRGMIDRAGGAIPAVAFRKNDASYRGAGVDLYALQAWCLELLGRAGAHPLPTAYVRGRVTPDFMRDLARLSWSREGPRLAQEFLGNAGIHLLILEHLPKTYLDGAALLLHETVPVIGLTLRYDRIDNFWFSLMHELAHVALHLFEPGQDGFFDDFDRKDSPTEIEQDADKLASEALIPAEIWTKSRISWQPTPSAVGELAQELGIHPAIVAGRARREHKNYRLLSQFVGSGEVRPLFSTQTGAE